MGVGLLRAYLWVFYSLFFSLFFFSSHLQQLLRIEPLGGVFNGGLGVLERGAQIMGE